MGVALVFMEKNKNSRMYSASQLQDGSRFICCLPRNTANLVTFFSKVWQKCTKFAPVQPGPYSKRPKLPGVAVNFHTFKLPSQNKKNADL